MIFTDDIFEQALEYHKVDDHVVLPIGITEDRRLQIKQLKYASQQNVLVTGGHRSGKSSYLRFAFTVWTALYGSSMTIDYLSGSGATEDFVWGVTDLGREEIEYHVMQHCVTSDIFGDYLQIIMDHVRKNVGGDPLVVVLDDSHKYLYNAPSHVIDQLAELMDIAYIYNTSVVLLCEDSGNLDERLSSKFSTHLVCSNMNDCHNCYIQNNSDVPLHIPDAWHYNETER